jgi:hypothetical protein
MFTFASGFEAAMLKFPSSSTRSREPTASLLAELAQLAASQQAAIAAGEQPDLSLSAPLEEALAALQLSSSTSAATTPSAALTPSAPSGAFSTGLPHLPTRRQTIGFARFRSRTDALSARDALQGKRVDGGMGGGTLKAEMAKKNLHTKRHPASVSRDEDLASSSWKPRASSGPAGGGGTAGPRGGAGQEKDWDVWFASLPPAVQQQIQIAQSQQQSAPPSRTGPASVPGSNQQGVERERQEREGREGFNGFYDYPTQTPTSPPQSITSPNARPTDSKALLALAEETDELEGWSAVSMGMTMDGLLPGYNRPSTASHVHSNLSTNTGISGSVSGGGGGTGHGGTDARGGTGVAGSVSGTGLTGLERVNPTSPSSSSLPLISSFAPSAHYTASANNLTNPNTAVGSALSPRGTSQSLPQGINMYRPPPSSSNGYYASSNAEFAGSPPASESLDGRGGPNPADQNPPVSHGFPTWME